MLKKRLYKRLKVLVKKVLAKFLKKQDSSMSREVDSLESSGRYLSNGGFLKKMNKLKAFGRVLALLLLVAVAMLSSCRTTKKVAHPVAHSLGNVGNSASNTNSSIVIIRALGKAEVTESGEMNAHEAAIENAMRVAVEKALGSQLRSETRVIDGMLERDAILRVVSGYVRSYKLLSEKNRKVSTGEIVKEVEVEAAVLLGKLKDDLLAFRMLQQRLNLPAVAVKVYEEKQTERRIDSQTIEKLQATVEGFLQQKGYYVVREKRQVAQQAILRADLRIVFRLDARENDISQIKTAGVDGLKSVTIVGSMLVEEDQGGTVIYARAIDQPGVGLSVFAASSDAVTRIAKKELTKLDSRLIALWDDQSNNGKNLLVVVSGVTLDQAKMLRKQFSPRFYEGVKKVFDKGYQNGNNAKMAQQTFVIRYFGDAISLGEKLTAKGKSTVPLKLHSYSASTLLLEVLP